MKKCILVKRVRSGKSFQEWMGGWMDVKAVLRIAKRKQMWASIVRETGESVENNNYVIITLLFMGEG